MSHHLDLKRQVLLLATILLQIRDNSGTVPNSTFDRKESFLRLR